MNINVVLEKGAFLPEKAHNTDAGFDLRTPIDFFVKPHNSMIVRLGVHMEIPSGYCGMIKSKSGLNVNHDLQCEGVVDSGFTGSIVCKIRNHGSKVYHFKKGDKVTQIVILPTPDVQLSQVDKLGESERGDSGFGSTGR